MDIIAKGVPDIDAQNLASSLQSFRDYMANTLELIDFTLSNQKNRIIGAVSQENFNQLAAAVSALSSNVASLSGTVNQLSEKVTEISDRMDTIESKITSMEESIASIDQRVTALEQAGSTQ